MIFILNLLLFNKIRVKKDSVFNLSFDNYEKNFLFIVNSERFRTSRIIADILSPKINSLHSTSPGTNTFTINTQNSGNFSLFLQLIDFNFNDIPEKEIPYINEIASILETQFIEISDDDDDIEFTVGEAINKLLKHEQYEYIYTKQIEKEIEFIANHFYLLNKEQISSIYSMNKIIIDKILNHTQLILANEDQLLKIVNNFYYNNSNYSYMYEFIEFNEVSNECFSNFFKSFNYSDFTPKVWNLISNRMDKTKNYNKKHQYTSVFLYENDDELNGIINFFRKNSTDINKEVKFTASSYYKDATYHSILNFTDIEKNFNTKSIENSWICLEFKNHLIYPTHYSIRVKNHSNIDNIKSWVVEGSDDRQNWFLVDERINVEPFLFRTFEIKSESKRMKFFRLRMIDKSWQNRYYLEINAIEIYGALF